MSARAPDFSENPITSIRGADPSGGAAAFSMLAELNPWPVLRVGPDGKVQMANQAARALFPGREIDGAPLFTLTAAAAGVAWAEMVAANTLFCFTARVGERSYLFSARGVALLEGAMVYGVDITGRMAAEENLRESESYSRAIADTANDALIILDDQGKVDYWNPAAERIFGWAREEIEGKLLADFIIPPRYREAHEHGLREFRETGAGAAIGSTVELSGLRKGGEEFPLELSLSSRPVMRLGRWRVVGTIRDITARKRIEEELRRAVEEAEEATRLKDKFISLVAHDLRAPFNSLLGFLRLLERSGEHPLDEWQKELVGRSLVGGENLLHMIDQLLNIGRLKTGKLELHRVFFNARGQVSAAMEELESMAAQKNVRMLNETRDDLRLYADLDMFGEVLRNLLSNAVKFCRPGDSVTVYNSGHPASLCVRDTGMGVRESFMEGLFRHEVKTCSAGSMGEKGTGLGLPFCADIIKAHGGSISVESREGRGAVFTVTLPEAKPRALVVDDDENDRFLTRQYLENAGVEVIAAADAAEALQILEHDTPHLLITDLDMPEVDGLELARRVRSREEWAGLPIVMQSASTAPEARDKARRAGINDFMVKPASPRELLMRVRRYLG